MSDKLQFVAVLNLSKVQSPKSKVCGTPGSVFNDSWDIVTTLDFGLWTCLVRHQRAVGIGPAIAEKLPRVSHFANHVEIQIGNHQRVLIARRLGNKPPSRIAKITLPVKLTNVPGLFVPDAIDRADEVTVRHRMRRLLDPP